MDGKEEKREIVWLPAELAARVKGIQDKNVLEREILAYIDTARKELKSQIECFDDDVLIFRGQLAKAKAAFKEAQEAHYNETYQMWEEFQKTLPQTKDFVQKAVDVLKPLKAELDGVNKLMQTVNHWEIERLIKLLDQVSNANPETQKVLRFLFENFKNEEAK
jgi:hypothetical protein